MMQVAYSDARGLWWSPRPIMMHVAYDEAPGLSWCTWPVVKPPANDAVVTVTQGHITHGLTKMSFARDTW